MHDRETKAYHCGKNTAWLYGGISVHVNTGVKDGRLHRAVIINSDVIPDVSAIQLNILTWKVKIHTQESRFERIPLQQVASCFLYWIAGLRTYVTVRTYDGVDYACVGPDWAASSNHNVLLQYTISVSKTRDKVHWMAYGSFTLMEMNSGADTDSDRNLMPILYCTEHVYTAQTQTWIPIWSWIRNRYCIQTHPQWWSLFPLMLMVVHNMFVSSCLASWIKYNFKILSRYCTQM